ncbi:recombinase family protein [Thalassotalea sp. PP2-459]|uniref:recombinase family protein n=1 Tax=Thalassotalea sp. PP2-459 TaxID=1742724 RepID=UPI0009420909|nr:recombinase family protein [Thalassotalea sp. PP2-459]OKY24966.1 hypothetical protein BI291_04415 [Thalassotalea sp. PP2-459]
MAFLQTFLKIVIYIRVSTLTQVKENMSLDDQLATLLKWAEENGHEVIKVYQDAGVSAFKGKRQQFDMMLNDIDSKAIDVDLVAVYDSTRFSRNEATRYNAEKILERNGVKLFYFMESIPEDADDAFIMKGINGIFAETFSRKNSKKSAVKLNSVAEQGYATGAIPPFGYQTIDAPDFEGSKKRKVYALHPENAEVVKKIFSLAENGESGCSYGVKKIAAYLNKKKIFKNGARWTPNAIHTILTDTTYYGERRYGKNRTRKDLNKDVVIIPVPKIIEKDTYLAVNKLLKSRAPNKSDSSNKAVESPKLLTSIIKCGCCGCNMVINTGKGGRYDYYKCRDKIKHSVDVCNTPNLPRAKIEKAVLSALTENIFTADFIEDNYQELKSLLAAEKNKNALKKANLQRKWNNVDSQVSSLISEIANQKLGTSTMIQRHLKVYEEKLSDIEASIDALDKKTSLPIMRFGRNHIENFVSSCNKVLLGGNTEATKALLLALVKDITVYKDNVEIRGGHLPLLANVANNKAGNPEGVPSLISIWR